MRTSFWRGVITGSIIGAAISMMAAGGHRGYISKAAASGSAREVKSRAHRVLRGVSKSVNDLVK